jgi:hypothetical protein
MDPNTYSDTNNSDYYNNLYGNFNRAIDPNLLSALRNQIKNGQIDQNSAHSQAVSSFGNLSNNVKYSGIFDKNIDNQLYSNLGTSTAGGQYGQYDNSGNFNRQTTALHQSIVNGGGATTNDLALQGGLTSNPNVINSIDQFNNPNSLQNLPNSAPPSNQTPVPQQSGVASNYLGQSKAIQGQLGNPGQIIKQ